MRQPAEMPRPADLMWPTLRALERLGGSASIRELDDRVSTDLGLAGGDSGCVERRRAADEIRESMRVGAHPAARHRGRGQFGARRVDDHGGGAADRIGGRGAGAGAPPAEGVPRRSAQGAQKSRTPRTTRRTSRPKRSRGGPPCSGYCGR